MGRYHLNNLKKFVPRTEFAQHSAGWQSIAEINEELQQLLLRPRRHQNQMEQALEEQEHREAQMNLPSEGWFRGPGDNLQGYGDEGGRAFWGPREIDLQRDMGLPPMYRNPGH